MACIQLSAEFQPCKKRIGGLFDKFLHHQYIVVVFKKDTRDLRNQPFFVDTLNSNYMVLSHKTLIV